MKTSQNNTQCANNTRHTRTVKNNAFAHMAASPYAHSFKKAIVPILAVMILLLLVAWLAGLFDDKVKPNVSHPTKTVAEKPTYNHDNTFVVSEIESTLFEPVAASVTAKQATNISSRLLARIESITVRAGDTVKQGETLVTLEQSELISQVNQATEQVNAFMARHTEAKQNNARAIELFNKQMASKYDLDKSKANYQSVKAELTAAEQKLAQTQAMLAYATLQAPIDGKVIDRFAEPGNTAQPGETLLSIYNPLSLRIEAHVREKLALTLKENQNLAIEFPAIAKTINGQVEEIVPLANTGSRSFLVKVRFNATQALLPGMYARLLVPSSQVKSHYIPASSVSYLGQIAFVWVVESGEIQRRFVRVGNRISHSKYAQYKDNKTNIPHSISTEVAHIASNNGSHKSPKANAQSQHYVQIISGLMLGEHVLFNRP